MRTLIMIKIKFHLFTGFSKYSDDLVDAPVSPGWLIMYIQLADNNVHLDICVAVRPTRSHAKFLISLKLTSHAGKTLLASKNGKSTFTKLVLLLATLQLSTGVGLKLVT